MHSLCSRSIVTRSDNKVRELATVCLPWQQLTEPSVWFLWRWHLSILQLCCCWFMAISFWVTSVIVWVCFGVPLRECRSLN
jgi:hypothetical protein